jgi:hypothetical protein
MVKKAAFAGAAAVLVLAALGATRGDAADKNNRFSVRGLGTTSCSKYLEVRNLNNDESQEFVHWFTGFLTAYNWQEPDTYDIAPATQYNSAGLLRFMDLYCGQSPTRRVIDAALGFVNAVYEKREKAGS